MAGQPLQHSQGRNPPKCVGRCSGGASSQLHRPVPFFFRKVEVLDAAQPEMNRELPLSLRDEITKKHQEGIALDQKLRQTLLRKLECTRETGILLNEAQDQIPRGDQWKEFVSSLHWALSSRDRLVFSLFSKGRDLKRL
jgi:hypothetical protein